MNHARRATTIPELLTALTTIIILIGLLVPTLARAQNASGETTSSANLRTIGAAHTLYASDWNGRQVTWVDDVIASYGNNCIAFDEYRLVNGVPHPPMALGWGRPRAGGDPRYFAYQLYPLNCANASLTMPINFRSVGEYWGSFWLLNSAQFNQYVGGRFYDPTFYAPKDHVVTNSIDAGECFNSPDGFCDRADLCTAGYGAIPGWSSYVLSPAAMFNPRVMSHDDPEHPLYNGWTDPWSLSDGFRTPPVFHVLYPHLKTHVLEKHWLQNAPAETCNPAFRGFYRQKDGECCEPWYFNFGLASSPVTLFYDGHVGQVSVADAIADDARTRKQNNPDWGLWSQDTPWGEDGYLSEYAYDDAQTSFHVLTTDGILGRDVLEQGVPRPARERATTLPRRPPPRRAPYDSTTQRLQWLEDS